MLSLFIWIAAHAAEALFCLWVLRRGGAERLEGTFASGFLFSNFAPGWSAEGLKMNCGDSVLHGGDSSSRRFKDKHSSVVRGFIPVGREAASKNG